MLSVKDIIGKIFELSLGAIIGGFIAIAIFGTSKLEYKDGFKEQYFDIPAKTPDELVIQYKGQKIENISVYDFGIYNRTYKDLKDVTIFFEVTEKEGKAIPQIISKGLYPPSRLPENVGISEVKQEAPNLYSFKLNVVKQTESDSYYLARFIFEGKESPDIKISIPQNAGIDIEEYSNWREYLILISIFIGMIVAIVIMSSLIDGWQNKSIWRKRVERLTGVLGKTGSISISKETLSEIVSNYEAEFKPKTPYFYRSISQSFAKMKSNQSINKDG